MSLPRPRPAWFGLDRILARIFPGFLLPLAETAETYPILLLALAQDLDPFKVGPGTGLLPRGPASLPERTRRTVREPAPPAEAFEVPPHPFQVPMECGEGFLDDGRNPHEGNRFVWRPGVVHHRTALCPASPQLPNAGIQIRTRRGSARTTTTRRRRFFSPEQAFVLRRSLRGEASPASRGNTAGVWHTLHSPKREPSATGVRRRIWFPAAPDFLPFLESTHSSLFQAGRASLKKQPQKWRGGRATSRSWRGFTADHFLMLPG